MTVIETYVVLVGLVFFVYLTAMKYNIPLKYENWYDRKIVDTKLAYVLPKEFCTLCFLTQLSLMASLILVMLLQLPVYHILMYGLGVPAYVIAINNLRHD